MRAILVSRYGAPDVLTLTEVPAPTPGDDDVAIEVVASSVNSADAHMMRGDPWLVRLAVGLRRPRLRALGADVAGRVVAVGKNVSAWRVGDEVIADVSGVAFGAFADVVTAPAALLVRKPTQLSFAQAAALPMAAVTAFNGLRTVAALQAGQRVLVTGAGGGVGSFAVQIARAYGAQVSAVCGTDKADRIAALGVPVHGHDALDAGTFDDGFDVVFDCAAYRSAFDYRRALKQGGLYVIAGGSFAQIVQVGLLGALVGAITRRRFRIFLSTANAADLQTVVELVEAGKLRPLLDARSFALADAADALRHLESRAACGKVIVNVNVNVNVSAAA